MTATSLRTASLILLSVASAGAMAARSDWTPADQSQLRLLLGQPDPRGIRAGIEIVLEPGWYTYWRNPGEAGVPPDFDFSGSQNVAAVEVLYPAPERYDDGSSVSLIYRDEVVFPLLVKAADPGKPVTLAVKARYGVCREVCIPTEAAAAVAQPAPGPPDPLAEARLQAFASKVPGASEPGRFDIEKVQSSGDELLIDVRMPDSSYSDLFAEPPTGWFIGQPALVSRRDGVSTYRLDLAGRPSAENVTGQRLRFVAVAGGEAIEEEVEVR